MLKRYIGDKAFYKRIFAIAIPIIIQNGITNFVSLLDNIMVGQVGTLPMTGVSIVNQLLFVFNLCIFGASSGAGIFTAQFYGSRDVEGVRHTFRFKLLICTGLTLVGGLIFLGFGDGLIGLYLTGEGDPADAAQALEFGRGYLTVMLFGLLPFALSNAYSSTLRETGETMVPMIGGISAVFVNLILNYILIFGHLGVPAMGVQGAAIATVVSRFVELLIVSGWTHLHRERNPFIVGAYRSMRIPGRLMKSICVTGMPLLFNEALWSIGIAFLSQCYSTCGLDVVPAQNISSTLSNLASVVFMSMGNSVGILMGQMLGADTPRDTLKDNNRKMIALSVTSGVVFGLLTILISPAFPQLYNASDSVRKLATELICISAVIMPFHAYTNASYFTLRSGGKTFITFLFDCCFVWVINVPLAYCLSRFTGISIIPLYTICQLTEILKAFIGYFLLRSGIWIQNLT